MSISKKKKKHEKFDVLKDLFCIQKNHRISWNFIVIQEVFKNIRSLIILFLYSEQSAQSADKSQIMKFMCLKYIINLSLF